MRGFLLLSISVLLVQHIVAPPVTKNHEEEQKNNEVDDMVFEYDRYLKEVIEALESDPDFRAKLEKAEESDIRSGKIAKELEFVNHTVRTKLDEAKRIEMERLKEYVRKKRELNEGHKVSPKIADHIDHTNEHTFEIEDLKKLIKKTNDDLAEADKKRREDFKEYEMQKKFEEEQKIKELGEAEKKKYAEELENRKKKHKKHDPLHHPGSKQQLEEVWKEQDHIEDQKFDPKAFFFLHDVDGNGYWDQDEVKALFLKELDKMYSEAPEDDPRERMEEMERMREHVFSEADTNHDGLISYEEFIAQTKKQEFQKDPGWKALDEQEIYSQQEYEAFERQREQEIEKMIAQGLIPPHPDYGHHGQFPPQHHDPNQAHYQGQVPVQQHHQGQVPVQQHYQGQIPVQQQQYQGQIPVQQQQVPVQNQHQAAGQAQGQYHQPQYQVPQGQPIQQQQYQPPPQQVPHDQVPLNGQFHPNNIPQQQINNQHVQGNIPVANQQQQPIQTQNIQNQLPQQGNPPQATGQAQQINGAHNVVPNVVHT